MRCHPGLRSPVRQGTMRGHALMVMSVRTAMDVAVPGRMQCGLPARPSSLVGLNGGGTGRSELRHWEQLQANACLGSRVVGVSRRRGRPDNGSQVMVLRLSGTRTRPGHVRCACNSHAPWNGEAAARMMRRSFSPFKAPDNSNLLLRACGRTLPRRVRCTDTDTRTALRWGVSGCGVATRWRISGWGDEGGTARTGRGVRGARCLLR
jgi:hypothetical protein